MNLTSEQQAIVHHPLGQHARVLAVAGSGKTTAMVHRVHHLVHELNQDPKTIRVVMFNRLARESFEDKLAKLIVDIGKRPKVSTFHSLAYSLRLQAERRGLIPQTTQLWVGDKQELALIWVHRAMQQLVREGLIELELDPQEVLTDIGLWKALLVPPERAGHRTNSDVPLIYRRFEELREQQNAMTFDDFVPKGLELLERDEMLRRQFENRLDHLIVDEYQDINYGQQQLIRRLAGTRANVMVVGDDDQTIYEWRAARPHYILQGFKEDFGNKPTCDYQLSRSFRFGPLIAQTAFNVIAFNTRRETKPLISHNVSQPTDISVWVDASEQATAVSNQMADEIHGLVTKKRVQPKQIAVLGRTFAQMEGLEAICLLKKIPFRVIGMAPFVEREENRTLIDYVRLALAWDERANAMRPWRAAGTAEEAEEATPGEYRITRPTRQTPTSEAVRIVLSIANTPSRKLMRDVMQRAVEQGFASGMTLGQSLLALLDPVDSPLPSERRGALQGLTDLLARMRERIDQTDLPASDHLRWLINAVDYRKHLSQYYGTEEASVERIATLLNFLEYARVLGMKMRPFLEHLESLDTTLGMSLDNVIAFTTVFRTKGLEYEYVFIPACVDGTMPLHYNNAIRVYDLQGITPDVPESLALESERRLYYVAMTRAIKHLYIGTTTPPEHGLQAASSTAVPSRFLDEMQLPPTRAAVGIVQRAHQDSTAYHQGIREAADLQLRGCRQLMKSVLDHYGPKPAARTLGAEIEQALGSILELDFRYSHEYPDVQKQVTTLDPKPPIWEDPWGQIGRGD